MASLGSDECLLCDELLSIRLGLEDDEEELPEYTLVYTIILKEKQ